MPAHLPKSRSCVDPRRHRRSCPARSKSHGNLAACRDRRARRRPEGIACDQEHGRGKHRSLARGPRRSHQARPAPAAVPDRRCAAGLEMALAAVWDGVPVQRCTVHKLRNLLAHAPERLRDEVSTDYTDMIYAATPEEIEQRRKTFIRKWRLKHRAVADSLEEAGDRLFTFTCLPPSQWQAREQRTRSSVCMRSSSGDQDADRAAIGRNGRDAVLRCSPRSDQHAQG